MLEGKAPMSPAGGTFPGSDNSPALLKLTSRFSPFGKMSFPYGVGLLLLFSLTLCGPVHQQAESSSPTETLSLSSERALAPPEYLIYLPNVSKYVPPIQSPVIK
jgi:hypothetical protein